MKKFYSALFAMIAVTLAGSAMAQKTNPSTANRLDYQRAGAPLGTEPADRQILAALKSVSAEKIKANIVRLVSFNESFDDLIDRDRPQAWNRCARCLGLDQVAV